MHLNTKLAGIPQDPSDNCNALCCPSECPGVRMTPLVVRTKGWYAVPENCREQTGQVNKQRTYYNGTENVKRN